MKTPLGPEHPNTLSHSALNHCFGCGPANTVGLHLHFELAPESVSHPDTAGNIVNSDTLNKTVTCTATLGDQYEGPPGYLHGGIIATLLDEAMSKANRANGHVAVTRHLEVDYLRPVPSDAAIRIEGQLLKKAGRKLYPVARIFNQENNLLATAKAVFIEIKPTA